MKSGIADMEDYIEFLHNESKDKNIMQTEYPLNLLRKIYNDEELDRELNEQQLKGLEYAVSTLRGRLPQIIELRYKQKTSLEEIAKQFNVTRERIRQQEAQAIRYLGNYSKRYYFEKGYEVWKAEREETELKKQESVRKSKEIKQANDYKRNKNMKIDDNLIDKINNDVEYKRQMLNIAKMTDFNSLNEHLKVDLLLFVFSNYSLQPSTND